MALPHVIPFAEAAAFTIGCAVLNTRRFDPQRVGIVLMLVIAALLFAILIVATATEQIAVPEPDELHSVLE